MIVVKVIGGLGNQLFQIAYAINVANRFNHDKIYLDITAFETYKIRSFSALNLCLPSNIVVLSNNDLAFKQRYFFRLTQVCYRVFQKFLKVCGLVNNFGKYPFKFLSKFGLLYNFDNFHYDTKAINSEVISIYGYFQSEKYFEECKSIVDNSFRVKVNPTKNESDYLAIINSSTSIAVSMRLGTDYTSSKILNVCDKQFYLSSIEELKNRIKNPKFFIFSDEIGKAKDYLGDNNDYIYIEGCNDYESLRLMYSCKHFVISNSSFSWWGAYLSRSSQKIILAPEKWYSDMDKTIDIYNDKMSKR
ncbi:alpha-1,2-fucosyltransferase [Shewanella sp. 10N.286.51.B8]|uniref:alpha-1,2-fucosyltransferase n=1 Tax=Shewanella sp. 10N.286.51.B8 TaxID=3229708 RepID=UPI00354BD936